MPMSPLETVQAFNAAMAVKDYGPAGVRGTLEPFFAPTIENEFIIKRHAVDGPVVFLERLDRHLLPTGWVELPVTGVYEVHDGKMTLYRDYFDAATILSKWPTA